MAELHARAFHDDRAWTEQEFAALLDDPKTIAIPGDHGFAFGRVVADEAEVLTIATDPAHRRQGHARAVLTRLHAAAKDHAAAQIFLEVAADNTAARALYAALGYAQVGRRPRYYVRAASQPVDALILRLAF